VSRAISSNEQAKSPQEHNRDIFPARTNIKAHGLYPPWSTL
jgi:hypothetical protein